LIIAGRPLPGNALRSFHLLLIVMLIVIVIAL
jgi:hypothetical protein